MKNTTKYLILLSSPIMLLFADPADHLIFKKIAIAPKEAEMAVIQNPTDHDIDLSNYYITDATKSSGDQYYFKLPQGSDYWSGSLTDFIARFPDVTIPAGGELTLGFHNEDYFIDYWGFDPDLVLFGDMLDAVDGETTISISDNFYTLDFLQNPEVLILFYWDGSSPNVQDVDYFLWGNTNNGVDKTGEPGYLPDTPLAEQTFLPSISDHKVYIRNSEEESGEDISEGNGITGHDETSEDLIESWSIVFNATRITPIEGIFNEDYAVGTNLIVQGLVVEFADIRPSNGPQIITIEDEDGYRLSLTVWDWDVQSSTIGPMVDPYETSQYIIQASGVLDFYLGWQLEILQESDIVQYRVLHPQGDFEPDETIVEARINPAPFVIIPSLGERLDFSYSFPSNSRVVIRLYDLSGRFITSLVDRYYEQAGTVYRMEDHSDWNGRDHLGQLVSPGTYIMHIETNNFSTGRSSEDTAPVVVGVRF